MSSNNKPSQAHTSDLIPIEEAKKIIFADIVSALDLKKVQLNISDAFHHVLAEDITSPIDVPGFNNSAMDGFAIRSAELTSKRKISISQTIAAGDLAQALESGTAARIFTGAMVPENADTVIAQENCVYDSKNVLLPEKLVSGDNIRLKGQDVKKHENVFSSGRNLQAQDIGMLASLGLSQVKVYKKLKVALVSTGNELLELGSPLELGKIYNSNRYMLEAFLKQMNVEVSVSNIVSDDLESTKACFKKLAAENDCLISTGGVSVGEADFVKQALEQLGQLNVWKLAIKPGKPFSYGRVMGKPFFGLPGNPVAVFVTFLVLVKPAIKKLQGENPAASDQLISFFVESDFAHEVNSKRQEYLRVSLKETTKGRVLELHPNQSSGVLSSTCRSDGLAVLEIGKEIKKGDLLKYIPYTNV